MAFTPSNLYLASLGSLKLNIAKVNASVTSGTNNWNSGITDIVAVSTQLRATTDSSGTGLAVSYTASNGTIWVVVPVTESASAFTLFVYSGLIV